MAPFLLQIASQGVVVIANGGPEDPSKGSTYESYGTYGRSSANSSAAQSTGQRKMLEKENGRIWTFRELQQLDRVAEEEKHMALLLIRESLSWEFSIPVE